MQERARGRKLEKGTTREIKGEQGRDIKSNGNKRAIKAPMGKHEESKVKIGRNRGVSMIRS